MDRRTFDLHGLILCVSEDFLSELLCIHNVDIETYGHYGLILYVSEDFLSSLLYIHNGNTDVSHYHEPL